MPSSDQNRVGSLQLASLRAEDLPVSMPVNCSQTEEWQSQFFRTKLCPYHLGGRCINGARCRFAHTTDELRPLPDLHRTKLCESYVKKEICNEPDCPFAHDPCELRTSSHSFYKVTLCNFYKKGRCWNGIHCRFAHGTSELQITQLTSQDNQLSQPNESDSQSSTVKNDTNSGRLSPPITTSDNNGALSTTACFVGNTGDSLTDWHHTSPQLRTLTPISSPIKSVLGKNPAVVTSTYPKQPLQQQYAPSKVLLRKKDAYSRPAHHKIMSWDDYKKRLISSCGTTQVPQDIYPEKDQASLPPNPNSGSHNISGKSGVNILLNNNSSRRDELDLLWNISSASPSLLQQPNVESLTKSLMQLANLPSLPTSSTKHLSSKNVEDCLSSLMNMQNSVFSGGGSNNQYSNDINNSLPVKVDCQNDDPTKDSPTIIQGMKIGSYNYKGGNDDLVHKKPSTPSVITPNLDMRLDRANMNSSDLKWLSDIPRESAFLNEDIIFRGKEYKENTTHDIEKPFSSLSMPVANSITSNDIKDDDTKNNKNQTAAGMKDCFFPISTLDKENEGCLITDYRGNSNTAIIHENNTQVVSSGLPFPRFDTAYSSLDPPSFSKFLGSSNGHYDNSSPNEKLNTHSSLGERGSLCLLPSLTNIMINSSKMTTNTFCDTQLGHLDPFSSQRAGKEEEEEEEERHPHSGYGLCKNSGSDDGETKLCSTTIDSMTNIEQRHTPNLPSFPINLKQFVSFVDADDSPVCYNTGNLRSPSTRCHLMSPEKDKTSNLVHDGEINSVVTPVSKMYSRLMYEISTPPPNESYLHQKLPLNSPDKIAFLDSAHYCNDSNSKSSLIPSYHFSKITCSEALVHATPMFRLDDSTICGDF